MRIAFYVLLLANLIYFAWATWLATPPGAPADSALAKVPRLMLSSQVPAAPAPAVESAHPQP